MRPSGAKENPADGRQLGTPTQRLPAGIDPRIQPSWQSGQAPGRPYVNNPRTAHNLAQPPWRYSSALRGHYIYDPVTDSIEMWSGQVFLRPAHISRTTLMNGSDYGPFPPQEIVPLPDSLTGPKHTSTSVGGEQQNHRPSITNPERQGHGLQKSSWNSTPILFPGFTVRKKKFFAVGRVFLVLWSEPANRLGTVTSEEPGIVLNHLGERVFSKVRRFVVVREGNGSCTALPISTYGGRGVAKAGVNKAEHVIIYTGNTPPQPQKSESPRRGEKGMGLAPIRVDPESPEDQLDPMARLDLAAVHTVRHDIKAKPVGIVNSGSKADLLHNFRTVLMKGEQLPVTIRRAPDDKVSDDKRAPNFIGTDEGDDENEESEDDDDNDDNDDVEDSIEDEIFDDHSAF